MSMKLKTAISALALAVSLPLSAATIKSIQVYNNLYNQGGTSGAAGMTPSNVTAQFFNGATQCDSVAVGFRAMITELVGTGSSQKCADVTSVKLVAGTSSINTALQVYNTTAVTVSITGTDYEHFIIVQDLGTGVTGTAAADGSIAPIFDATNGTVATQGTPGYVLTESKLR